MTRTALLLPLALLGLTSTAYAGIDDVAASMLDGHDADLAQTDDVHARTTTTTTKSHGNKTATRQTSTSRSGGKQAQRTTYSNGNKSHTTGRARSVSQSQSSAYGSNGDRHHRQDTEVKLRAYSSTTNGTKTVTQKRGANIEQTRHQGVQDGERYRHTSSTGTARTHHKATNSASGRTVTHDTRTHGTAEVGFSNGRKTVDSRTTTRQTRGSDTHPNRPSLAIPGGRPNHMTTRPGQLNGARANARPAPTRSPGARPGPATRPGPAARPGTATRPGGPSRTTVVTRPSTRTTVVTGRPTTVVHHRTVTYHTVRPYHGVFVYGPAPVHHHHYHSGGPAQVKQKHMPERDVDRANSVAVGLKMGSLASGYYDGGAYGDLGVGLAGRYRPAESVGLQVDLTHHAQSWGPDTERSQTVGAASVQLFAFPWTRVSPYAIGGVTYDARNIQDDIYNGGTSATVIANDALWGLHGGLGLELAMGKSLALDLEGRYIGYLDKSPTDPSLPGALQLTGGLMVHF